MDSYGKTEDDADSRPSSPDCGINSHAISRAGPEKACRMEGLLAEVVIATGFAHITAIITSGAVRELQLKKGDPAAALIKSTDVMIERL
jgi:molybdopterin-binding protein